MTKGRLELQEAAEKLARDRWDAAVLPTDPRFQDLAQSTRDELIEKAREELDLAYRYLLPVFKEQLLSDEALEAAAAAAYVQVGENERDDTEAGIKAALASIDSDGGTD